VSIVEREGLLVCFLPHLDSDLEGESAVKLAGVEGTPSLVRRCDCVVISRRSEWRAASHSVLSGTARSIVADFFEFLSLSNNGILLLMVLVERFKHGLYQPRCRNWRFNARVGNRR
jgi:hypothetical protein